MNDDNTKRLHQSLGMAPPAQRFEARAERCEPDLAPDLRVVTEDRSAEGWVSRTVSVNGTISVSNQVFSVGKQRARHLEPTQLDEEWGSHGDDCPRIERRHLICTNPDCLWVFTMSSRPGKVS